MWILVVLRLMALNTDKTVVTIYMLCGCVEHGVSKRRKSQAVLTPLLASAAKADFCYVIAIVRLVDWYRGYGATTPCAPRP
jgi:hypothetical protein